ncbi:YxD-tail cyclophane-containing RiPP peptide [Streptomyces sp. NPDC101455]|uniref:YxD-tail cyclophane-containing RiPP peptide n=1 Tax=Streptomyces sp. NPDC101455 TaxID=3366142 RepID=UPI00380F57F2
MSDLARYDVEEYRVADPPEQQQPTRHERGGPGGHAGNDDTPLPDYTGVDLTALRARVDHPVLGAVLATLLARSCGADGGLVAYHEDSPGAER